MSKIKKVLKWYFLLLKRLFYKRSFLVLLIIIPIVTPIVNIAMTGESGVLCIALCNEGENPAAEKVISTIKEKDGIIRYSFCNTEEEAIHMVKNHEADAAWIFDKDFEKKLDNFTMHRANGEAVKIVERETNIALSLSREMLFGAMYGEISKLTYKNFVYQNMLTREDVAEEKVIGYFTSLERKNNVILTQKIDSFSTKKTETTYLTAPLRGILALLILLCALASAMYFLKDNSEGKFDKIPPKRRIVPQIASLLAGVTLASTVVFITLFFSGIWTNALNEFISIVLYALSLTAFCMVICVLFKSYGKLGVAIPAIMIASLALSPIFFSLKVFKPLRLLIPAHYYLYAIYDTRYYIYTVVYSVVMICLALVLNNLAYNEKNAV